MRLLFSALALTTLAAPADTLGVTVEPGTKITKTFTNSLELELVDITVEVDGEEIDIPAEQIPEVTINDDEEIVFVDEYVEVEDGKPTQLVRHFETLDDTSQQTVMMPDAEEQTMSEDGESQLLGRKVRFTWDSDAEEYEVAFADDEDPDESLLEDLEADADYRYFLPGEDVAPGESWEVELVAFDRVSSPSGDLKIDSENDDDDDEDFSEKFRDNLDGELEATLSEIEDGVATITIAGSVTTSVESEIVPEQGPEMTRTISFEFEIEGTLLWDLELGTAKSFTMGGDVAMEVTTEPGGGMNLVQTQSFEGAYKSTASFE